MGVWWGVLYGDNAMLFKLNRISNRISNH